ncbi:MAG: DegT/DnrJ/EryC1/StrS family aminotransferase [Caldilineaceae bacterium]|nr:DegT/DnrJ/EryC1/StrS family aminotransferase [Caldilineaceae bacterium]
MAGPGMELVGEEEIEEVLQVLRAGYLYRYGVTTPDGVDPRFQGKVYQLEQEIAAMSQVQYAVAVNSGTSALLAAMAALGIGPGDEVIVPGFTFVASISAIVYTGAVPVLAEIDRTFNLDPDDVKAKISPRTKAIMAVHMMGNPARLEELRRVADINNLYLIEDCCQAFGAAYRGRPIGSIGHVGAFSFNIYKTITSGDGGMIITDDEELYRRAFAFHDQGHSPLRTGVEIGRRPFLGLDFRCTELQAAVLLAQLRKLPTLIDRLQTSKRHFKAAIFDLPGLEFREVLDPEEEVATILTVILPDANVAAKIAAELDSKVVAEAGWHVYNNMEHLLEQRMPTPLFCSFSCPHYAEAGGSMQYGKGMLPRTDDLLARSINISIGVSDAGLGSAFGVTINDDLDVVAERADTFRRVASSYLI